MIDIVSVGQDIGLFNTQAPRAANILSVQLAALEYAPQLGIDLKYFLSEEFRFQNSSFKAYLVEVLANNSINVSGVTDIVESLFSTYTISLKPEENGGSLIAG